MNSTTEPAFSRARSIAIAAAPPELMPSSRPSSRASARVTSSARCAAHLADLCDVGVVEDRRHVLRRPRANAGDRLARRGLHPDHLDGGRDARERARHARHRARSAHRAHHVRECRAALLGDLDGRGAKVRGRDWRGWRTGRAAARPSRSRCSPRRRERSPCRSSRSVSTTSGAVGAHRVEPLLRRACRHHQHHAVAPARGRRRERDARVAARRLDDVPARLQLARLNRGLNHRERGAVLHGARGIRALELGEHDGTREAQGA